MGISNQILGTTLGIFTENFMAEELTPKKYKQKKLLRVSMWEQSVTVVFTFKFKGLWMGFYTETA